MAMQHYQGSCHCGAISFSFEGEPITKGLRCNCSYCTKRGTVILPYRVPEAQFHFQARDGMLGLYQFGAMRAKHYFCKHCGVHTFTESGRAPGHYLANLGCVEGVDTFALEIAVFDGRSLPLD